MDFWLAGLGAAAIGIALAWRGRFLLVTVAGTSMQPSLRPGDRLLVRRTGLHRIRVGQVAVLRPPALPGPVSPGGDGAYLVKRVAAVPGDRVPESCRDLPELPEYVPPGSFIMLGDNPRHSYDSRFAGLIPAALLFGVAVRRIGGAASVGHEPRSGYGRNAFQLKNIFRRKILRGVGPSAGRGRARRGW